MKSTRSHRHAAIVILKNRCNARAYIKRYDFNIYKVDSVVSDNLKPVCEFVRKASGESIGLVQPNRVFWPLQQGRSQIRHRLTRPREK